MPTNIIIKIETKIKYNDGDVETISSSINGRLYLKGKEYYIRYKENQELGDTSTIIKWNQEEKPPTIAIIRQGDVRTTQIFQQKKNHVDTYSSPNGTMELTTITSRVKVDQRGASKGILSIIYRTKMNQQLIGDYNTQISYEEAK